MIAGSGHKQKRCWICNKQYYKCLAGWMDSRSLDTLLPFSLLFQSIKEQSAQDITQQGMGINTTNRSWFQCVYFHQFVWIQSRSLPPVQVNSIWSLLTVQVNSAHSLTPVELNTISSLAPVWFNSTSSLPPVQLRATIFIFYIDANILGWLNEPKHDSVILIAFFYFILFF